MCSIVLDKLREGLEGRLLRGGGRGDEFVFTLYSLDLVMDDLIAGLDSKHVPAWDRRAVTDHEGSFTLRHEVLDTLGTRHLRTVPAIKTQHNATQ